MITDKTLDEALVELLRTKRALEALRAERKAELRYCPAWDCEDHREKMPNETDICPSCSCRMATSTSGPARHAAAKRATLDLTRKLADLRAGR